MLIIARKQGEKITIGDDTVITLLEIKDNQVRVGIEAPRHITVHRQEVYDRIKKANQASAKIDLSVMLEAAAVLTVDQKDKEQL
jgi:carbon storage regulator